MNIKEIRRENARSLSDEVGGIGAFADRLGKKQSQISAIIGVNPSKGIGHKIAAEIEAAFNKPSGWMDIPHGDDAPTGSIYGVKVAEEGDDAYEIRYMEAKGSCGGGSYSFEELEKGKLVKEASFFRKYNVKPQDVVVVYADGNSNAEFIIDGDMVLFDTSKTTPKSGELFLINHPDGLRIKVLRQNFDRSWEMESKNQDKNTYPNEHITEEQAQNMVIVGQFFYRQGG